MAGIFNSRGSFTVTPHKVAICALIQIYAPPAQVSTPFPFSSVSQHNRLGLFLLALTKSFDDIADQKLGELIGQLKEIDEFLSEWISGHLTRRLSSLLSPDDLFSFFADLRGVIGGPESSIVEDDQIILDPSSNLGIFIRRCILAFNQLSYEGASHLSGYIGTYYKEYLALPYEEPHASSSRNDSEGLLDYENMDLENLVFEEVTEEMEAIKRASRRVAFHIHTNKALHGLIQDIELSTPSISKSINEGKKMTSSLSSGSSRKGPELNGGTLLRNNWQIQGYLHEQAEAIEKHGSFFSLNDFGSILKQLQKLAPELHRVHFVRHLNNLHHSDYPASLESLVCYFDYSAGMEGLDSASILSPNNFGRYEVALLCLGMMHFHFGHPNEALKVLTEAVSFSQQQSNDVCLAYTLAVICSLLSETGIVSTSGILSSLSPIASIGTSVSIQQQLFLLLRRSTKRAEMLKLKQLVASNHLAIANFGLTHVERPLLSFGPKASMDLKTCPATVCKEIRQSSHLLSEFGSESSAMMSDGALSTTWLKNLQKAGSSVLSEDNVSKDNPDGVQFCAQRSTIPGSVLQVVGSSYLLRANAWELYGSAPLARINATIHATCFANASSSDDLALSYTKLIQHIAVFKGYKEAFAAFKIAEPKFISIAKSRMLLVKLQLLHEHALHRGHLKLAQQVCNELEVLASCVIGVDMELNVESSLRHARTLLAAKQFSQAAAVAHSLFCMCYKFNMQVEIATVLLLLAEIHKKSGNAVQGLPYALASLSFCQSFNLDLLRASTTLTLAELWLSLGSTHTKRALTLLHGAFPMILGHGGLELCARAYIAEAKCYLSDPTFSVSDDPELVLEPLIQASNDLLVLEYHELAAEAFYLMALVYDKLGRPEEREEAAASFQTHLTILENPQDLEDHFLFIL